MYIHFLGGEAGGHTPYIVCIFLLLKQNWVLRCFSVVPFQNNRSGIGEERVKRSSGSVFRISLRSHSTLMGSSPYTWRRKLRCETVSVFPGVNDASTSRASVNPRVHAFTFLCRALPSVCCDKPFYEEPRKTCSNCSEYQGLSKRQTPPDVESPGRHLRAFPF